VTAARVDRESDATREVLESGWDERPTADP
jgi:hypothetical protein